MVFADQGHAYRAMTDQRVTGKLFPLLESRQMLGLAAWDNGFKHMTSNKCPIVKPEDMKGQKIRVQSSKVLEERFRTVGANPQVMAFGEVYNVLERGVVDGEGMITPPVGLNLYHPPGSLWASLPWMLVLVAALAIVTYVPALSLAFPHWLCGVR